MKLILCSSFKGQNYKTRPDKKTTKNRLQLRKAMDGILGRWLRHFRREPRPLWSRCFRPAHSDEPAGGRAAAQTPHCACFGYGGCFQDPSAARRWIMKGRLLACFSLRPEPVDSFVVFFFHTRAFFFFIPKATRAVFFSLAQT